ncbi:MAG TPA: hypothetical protein VFO29_10780 [Candidatus Rubrimentiphilum sp.]|nr:hypothetical protein [Candidatus Rubrimentiphilum sp.]
MRRLRSIFLVASALLALPLAAGAASAPAPVATPKLPTKPLHVDLQVEVNKLGQVVRVLHGNLSGNVPFDTMVMGNALQMWIRDRRGQTVTAVVGLYRVNYDYDPRKHSVHRKIALIKRGGNWANEDGAATKMLADAKKQAQAAEEALARLRAEQKKQQLEQNNNLPDINGILKKSTKPSPSPSPHA